MVDSFGAPSFRSLRSGWVRAAFASALALALVSCGGSKGDPCGLSVSCAGTAAAGSSGSTTGSSAGTGTSTNTTTPVPVAADMSLTLSAPTVLNSGGDTVTATAILVDANRNLLANVPVTFSVDANATAAVAAATTNADGVTTARVGIGADRSNRVITLTATSGNLVRTATVQVTGAKLVATPLPASLAPGAAGTVRFRLTDVNSNAIALQDVIVAGVGGVEVKGKTDTAGLYDYAYTAPAAAGNLSITASAAGVSLTQSVQVQSVATIDPAIASPPLEAATVSVSSAVVPANVGSTNNSIDVRALFLRETNQPAQRVRVRFDLAGNANDVPGSFSTGTSILYTDSTGTVRTSYTPGGSTSPLDGVTIRACWDYVDFAVGACPNQASTKVTVVSEPLSISIGTDNKIALGTTDIDYVKRYLVQVNDASGGPKADVQLSGLVDMTYYLMGYWELVGVDWKQRIAGSLCENEDLNRNAVNEIYANGAVEDVNGNGQLDPRKADVIVSFDGPSKTNAAGQAVLKITYPQNVGSWSAFTVSVIAGGANGSEGRARFSGVLSVLDEHVTSQDRQTPPPPPAFVLSPYNIAPYNLIFPAALNDLISNSQWSVVPTVVTNPDGVSGVLCKKVP